MAGQRSLLAPWIGGAAAPAGSQGGVRSLLAPWIGGASAPAAPGAAGGYRSLLAFWLGGACAGPGDVEPPTPPEVVSGGGGWAGWRDRPDGSIRRRKRSDEEEKSRTADQETEPPAVPAVSFAIGDRPGANALRQRMLQAVGLTARGREVIEHAPDEDLTLILALMWAMDD